MRRINYIPFLTAIIFLLNTPNSIAITNTIVHHADYGVFAKTVSAAEALISSAIALSFCWKGKLIWAPTEEDAPESTQKFSILIIAVINAIIWYLFSCQHLLTANDLLHITEGLVVTSIVVWIIYNILISMFVYKKIISVKDNQLIYSSIIGGFWLTNSGRDSLLKKGPPPHPSSIEELFSGLAYDPDRVWPRSSRALTKVCFQISYIILVAAGTCSLTTISLLISTSS